MLRRFLSGFARIPPGLVVLSSLCGALLGLAVSTLTVAGPSLLAALVGSALPLLLETFQRRDMKIKNRKNRKRLVKCSTHGDIEGYVCCIHVAENQRRSVWVEPIGQSHPTLGTILCADCVAPGGGLREGIPQSMLVMVCGLCARDRGINRPVVQ